MSPALLDSPASLFAQAHRQRPAGGSGATLEERLEAALRSVQAGAVAECPVCRTAGMSAEGAEARCSGCGSTLA